MGGLDVFIRDVLPWIGNVTSASLFLTTLALINGIRKSGEVGAVNPLPFVMQFFQSQMWAMYGFFIANITIIPVNILGSTIGVYGTLIFYGACKDAAVRSKIERALVVVVLFPVTLATALQFAVSDNDTRSFVYGVVTNVVSLAFFASPLSTLATICRTRDSSSLYAPTSVTIIANGVCWTVYGLWIGTLFIWIPNSATIGLGALQLAVGLCIPSRSGAAGSTGPRTPAHSDAQPFFPVTDLDPSDAPAVSVRVHAGSRTAADGVGPDGTATATAPNGLVNSH